MKYHLFAAFIATSIVSAPAPGQHTIEQLAPENTIAVVGCDNVQSMMDNLKRTGVWELWQSDEIKETLHDFLEEFAQQVTDMYDELGMDEEDMTYPTGPAGFSLYTYTDEETMMPKMATFFFAHFGDEGEKFGALMDRLVEKTAEEWDTEFEFEEVMGREVIIIEKPPALEDPDELDEGDFGGMSFLPDPEDMVEDIERMYLVREGSLLLGASEMSALQTALEIIDGEGPDVLDSREDYQNARRQIGEADFYGLLLTRDLGDLVDSMDDTGMMRMMVGPSVNALIGDIGGMGFGGRSDGPTSMLEQTFTMYMPNGKGGIFSLLDIESPRGDLPAFVGPDAISYASYNFRFSGILDFVKGVIQSNPMLAMQAAEQMPVIEEFIHGLLDPLGSRIDTVSTLRRPIEAGSMGTFYAIECNDPQAFEEFIADKGAAMGLEPRDFLGHRIYAMDGNMLAMMTGGMDMSFALGLGGGRLFLGSTSGVEQALRTVGQEEQASLGDEAEFKRGVAALNNQPLIGWGYADIVDALEVQAHVGRIQMEQTIAQMEEFDPEMAAEMKAELQEQTSFYDKIDPELLRRYIGPSVWQMMSTEKGFVFRQYILKADSE
ncbi:MAG: hypothetical protein O7G85_08130 [Planctomycetota bacterium]|nr:hypothetical protein [Planctomycetota bacterium]